MDKKVRAYFPELKKLTDGNLRQGIIEAWCLAIEDTNITPDNISWTKAANKDFGDWSLVTHTNQVATVSISIVEAFELLYKESISTDTVIAGALIHDIGKLYEKNNGEYNIPAEKRLIGHPYFGIYPVLNAGLPLEVAHIVLSHSHHCPIQSKTPEATVIDHADELVAWEARRNMQAEGIT